MYENKLNQIVYPELSRLGDSQRRRPWPVDDVAFQNDVISVKAVVRLKRHVGHDDSNVRQEAVGFRMLLVNGFQFGSTGRVVIRIVIAHSRTATVEGKFLKNRSMRKLQKKKRDNKLI